MTSLGFWFVRVAMVDKFIPGASSGEIIVARSLGFACIGVGSSTINISIQILPMMGHLA